MSRLTLAERIIIECGIYQKLKLSEIARKIGKSPESVSREIRANRTIAPGEHHFGKDCRFAGECKTKGLCRKEGCSKRCVNRAIFIIISFPMYLLISPLWRRKHKTKKEVAHKKYAQPPRHKYLTIIKTKKGQTLRK